MLIQLAKTSAGKLNDRKTKKSVIWREVTEKLQRLLPGVSRQQVETKWRQLKAQYRIYENNKTKNDRGRRVEPKHYDLMSSFLKNWPLSEPSIYILEGSSSSLESVSPLESPTDSEPHTDDDPLAASLSPPPACPVDITTTSQDSPCPSPPPAKTRRKMRPANESVKIYKVLQEIKVQQALSASRIEELHTKQLQLLSSLIDRDAARHKMEMAIKEEQLTILRLRRQEMENRISTSK